MRSFNRAGVETWARKKGGEIPLALHKNQPPGIINPYMYIDTGGVDIVSKVDYLNCEYRIVNDQGNGELLMQQVARVRGRGNSTWEQVKKPYKVKLTNAASMLGMPSSKDWALLANYFDPSRLRNAVAFEMASRTSILWAPRTRYVEVILNGSYNGLYGLTESVEVDPARNNIVKIKATDVTGKAVTGGYLVEIDVRMEANNETGFRTRLNVPIIADTPDLLVPAQFDYVKATFQNLEDKLFSNTFTDPVTGYRPLIDMDTWIDWYLLVETVANNDSGFGASIKMYKDRDPVSGTSKIFIGPPWDYDLTFSIGAVVNPHPYNKWWTRLGATWLSRMMEDPTFYARLQVRWTALKAAWTNPSNSIYDWTSNLAAQVASAMGREGERWTLGSAANINTWLAQRIAWLDGEFTSQTDQTPPAVPTGLAASSSGTTINVSWDAVTAPLSGGTVFGYRVWLDGSIAGIRAFPYDDAAVDSGPGLYSIGIKNVAAGVHSVTVQARDDAGNWSVQTSTVSVTV